MVALRAVTANEAYRDGARAWLTTLPPATGANQEYERGMANYTLLRIKYREAFERQLGDELPISVRWLGKLLIARPYLGIWIYMTILSIVLWAYTIKGIHDAGWWSAVPLLPMAVMGTALGVLIGKFAWLSERFHRR